MEQTQELIAPAAAKPKKRRDVCKKTKTQLLAEIDELKTENSCLKAKLEYKERQLDDVTTKYRNDLAKYEIQVGDDIFIRQW